VDSGAPSATSRWSRSLWPVLASLPRDPALQRARTNPAPAAQGGLL
jgi:hypothetical protein